MSIRSLLLIPGMAVLLLAASVFAKPETNKTALKELSRKYAARLESMRGPAFQRLQAIKTGPMGALNRNKDIFFVGIDGSGPPLFYQTNNLNAARTIAVDLVWPGGETGYNLTGEGTGFGELAVWDAGIVRNTHQEFGGRVWNMDDAVVHWHTTHVAGTLIAAGINGSAKGMSPEANYLFSFDWYSDTQEMAETAADFDLKVSNHSYGLITGWDYDYGSGSWYWYGDPQVSENEDYGFGYYSSGAQEQDEIAYNAPYYSICKAAGNDRGEGPSPGTQHWVWENGGWVQSTQVREIDGGPDGYDCISYTGNAKNIITVGAVNDIPNGYSGPNSVSMSSFSGWGPTDDGRIKPDLVANGIQLLSTSSDADNAYTTMSGTSMASPNLAGALNLLVQFYKETHDGQAALASTMKALLIHTADESGSFDGPDYKFGWGLMNTSHAADVINLDATVDYTIREIELGQGEVKQYFYNSDGSEPITFTICWTDPPGTPVVHELDPDTPMLVNDLDIRLQHIPSETVYFPYVLNPDSPSSAATTGDNTRDNVEKIYVADPPAGDYIVEISHKDNLTNAPQAFGMILTGLTWLDDPRVPPEDLTADINYGTGQVELNWTFSEDLDDFVDFLVYRNGDLVGSSEETNFIDNLPGFGIYSYYVTSEYDEGESLPTEVVSLNWLAPISPISLHAELLQQDQGDLTFTWEHLLDEEVGYDDDSREGDLVFNADVPSGAMFAQRLTSAQDGRIVRLGAYLAEDETYSFGEMHFVVYGPGDDESTPGELLYTSESFVPDAEGWSWSEVAGDPLTVTDGGDFWVAVAWDETGHTILGNDMDGDIADRGVFSVDGTNWDAVPGLWRGNPMIRAYTGADQVPGQQGLVQYRVYRDGDLVGETTETTLADVLPSMGTYTYVVTAEYEQGDADSEPYAFYWGEEAVPASNQPRTYTVGAAYPNPFNAVVTVPVSLADAGKVRLTVYDVLGREITRIESRQLPAGSHRLSWNGRSASAGVYFLRVQAGPVNRVQKIVLLK